MPNHKGKNRNLGKSLIKKKYKARETSSRHTTDGPSQPSISITENTTIDEFISNAEAAQRNFEAERSSRIVVTNDVVPQSFDQNTLESLAEEDEEEFNEDSFCTVPKKPDWQGFGSEEAKEYKHLESLEFLKWKRQLNQMQNKYPKLPLFEKNLDFWRQLWKIIEISDVVIQVVDSRDPLFYQCMDLSNYVIEMGMKPGFSKKYNVLLLNKADFLTETQREYWCDYFRDSDTHCLFFSATIDDNDKYYDNNDQTVDFNTSRILHPANILDAIISLYPSNDPVTIGFLGYPNVGKSSTINRFLNSGKRIQVSATPGKTKHYQTHSLQNGKIILVDGPGLVIPSFKMGKAEMVLAGILPIDNLTEYFTSIELLLTKLDFHAIRRHYGIMSTCIVEAKRTTDRTSSEALQLLSAFGIMRGFMKPGGVPDHAKAARIILKDFCAR